MTIHSKKYFCYEIFKNIAIWSKKGKLSYNPCSFYNGFIKTTDTFDLHQVWNNTEHTKLKTDIKNDIPSDGCRSCYDQEKHGLVSRRIATKNAHELFFKNTDIDLDTPSSIDYSVGNLCNLKCIICNPSNSTSWLADWQKLYPDEDSDQYKFDKFNQIEVIDTDLLKNITNVHFHGGGEPLLSSSHVNLLKAIKQAKGLQDVRVYYNTNGTVRVSEEVLHLWEECRLIELYFSIDDTEKRFEYQRTGARWDDLKLNIEWYKNNMPSNHLFKINCVWSYLNLFYLDELVNWHSANFATNRLGDDTLLIFQKAFSDCRIDSASDATINILLKKFEKYPELLNLVNTITRDNSSTHHVFLNYISKIDKIRNTNFYDLCPDWAEILTSIN